MISLVEEAGAALTFEIVDNVGEGGFFEDVCTDDKGFGVDGARAADDQPVGAGGGKGSEIDGCKLSLLPVIDGTAINDFSVIDVLVGSFVNKVENHRGKAAGGDEDSALGFVGFVTDLVGEDFGGLDLGFALTLRPEGEG